MTQTVLLGDEIELIGGGTPKTTTREFWGGGVPWLSVVDFSGDARWVKGAEKSITELGLEKSSTKLLKAGDIIISARGTVGELAQLTKPMAFNQSCYGVRAKESIDQDYLYYLLKHSIGDLQRQAHGGVFSTITRETFNRIKVSLPDLEDQKKIAYILGTIDEKIELNRKINETLEQMGQALFRHYFIDNPEVEEWHRRYLGDFVEIVNGASYKSAELQPSSNALVTLKSVGRGGGFSRRGYKEYIGKMKDTQVVRDGDLVVAHTDLTQKAEVAGYPALVDGADQYKKVAISMDLVKVVPRSSELSSSVVYFLLKTREFQDHKMGYISGSTVLHLNKKCIPDYKIALPDDEGSLCEISEKFDRFMEQIKVNNQQIQTLTTIRDTLLPRLISRKVNI